MSTVLDDALEIFVGYYGGVQPFRRRARQFRMELFQIVEIVAQLYPGEMSSGARHQCYFLLYIAAISGARDHDLEDCRPTKCRINITDPFLGLDIKGGEFASYPRALAVLATYFEDEFGNFQPMAAFLRANYPQARSSSAGTMSGHVSAFASTDSIRAEDSPFFDEGEQGGDSILLEEIPT
jgi:hypothetical protein